MEKITLVAMNSQTGQLRTVRTIATNARVSSRMRMFWFGFVLALRPSLQSSVMSERSHYFLGINRYYGLACSGGSYFTTRPR